MAAAGAAAAAPTQEEMAKYVAENTDSDLAFIFADSEVGILYQYKIVVAGFRTLKRFSALEESRAALRAALLADFGLDPASSLEARLNVTLIVNAWEAAREQVTREIQMRAEAKALQQPRPVGHTERTAMRRVVEARYGKIPDDEAPGAAYLALKMEEVEQNEPRASPLDEVISIEDGDEYSLGASIDLAGGLRVTRQKAKSSMPGTPEALRRRLRVESNVWLYLSTKFGNRPWLSGLTQRPFMKLADHILGKKGAELEVATPASDNRTEQASLKPPWQLILSYEHELRKRAFYLVREEGQTLEQAIDSAIADQEVRALRFINPLSLLASSSKRSRTDTSSEPALKTRAKGKGRGNAKGGKKGSGKDKDGGSNSKMQMPENYASRTPDGRLICFKYNRTDGSCSGRCNMLHVCQVKGCHDKHPAYSCPKNTK
jgi:hypothetical protein